MTIVDVSQVLLTDQILVVDDDIATRQTLKTLLEQEGYRADTIGDGQVALEKLEQAANAGAPYSLVLVDLHLQDMSGIAVLRRVRELCPETQRVIITGHANVESAVQALREGAQEYLLKPYYLDELKVTVAKLLRVRREAVRNAELLAEARRRASELAVLNRVGQVVTRSLDLDEVLSLIQEQIREALQVAAGSIALLEDGKLVFKVASGPAAETVKSFCLEPGQGLVGSCVAENRPIITNSVETDSRHFREIDEKTHFVTKSVLCVPMRAADGKVIGAIEAINRLDGKGFSDNDLALLQAISVSASAAVENAKLHTSLEERASELRKALDNLKQLDRLKSEFVQNISHELRTPLTFVKGYVELLQSGMLGPTTEEQAEGLQLVSKQAEVLVRLVDDIILMQEYKLDLNQVQILSLRDVICSAATQAIESHPEVPESRIAAELGDDTCCVEGNWEYLVRTIYNLLDNALKFDPDGGVARISLHDLGHVWEIRVSDTGIGIPEAELERTFERFYQVDGSTTRRFGGAGLGLAVAKEIVEAHKGTIWVQSQEGEGSTFGIQLPKAAG